MLQRAASNAYSWWWASHIRTTQSKWLDSDLQDMEDRVKSMLKLIEGDADSFGKRAELYFKSRPELVSFVEEAYKAYRALAERYDHISGELHKANHTIATAFPDQVQYAMLEEEEDNFPKAITPIGARKIHKPTVENLMSKRKEEQSSINKTQHRSITSQIDKDKAQEEINRLQKAILVLQTEKEFIKSSYESGMAKYWEIEKQITEMQDEVCCLQDEFNTSAVIEDNEARALMTATALKSCEDAIVNLHEQRKKSVEQARLESGRIRVAEEKLKVLKGEDGRCNLVTGETGDGNKEIKFSIVNMEDEVYSLKQERLELQKICEKVQEHFEVNSDTSVEEIVEKIDEIVKSIVSLELKVSSQTAQINRLSSENNELEKYLQSLEEEKMVLINDSNELNDILKQAEEELLKVQILEKTVQDEETILCANFADACHSLNVISEKLLSLEHQEQVSVTNPFIEEQISLYNVVPQSKCRDQEVAQSQDSKENSVKEGIHGIQELGHSIKDHDQSKAGSELENDLKRIHDSEKEDKKDSSQADASIQVEIQTLPGEQEGTLDLQQILLNGLEDREKVLLAEYTSVLRNYKEAKKRLSEVEKKNQEYVSETMAIIRELTNANAMKDEEIQSLRQHLGFSKMSSNGHADAYSAEAEDLYRGHRRLKSVLHLPTLRRENSNLPNSENPKVNVQSIAKVDTLTMAADRGSPHVEDIKLQHIDEPQSTSSIEEKFRRDIDVLLEENLHFWLKFSTTFHRIQEFQTTLEDLQSEMEKLRDSKLQEGINSAVTDQVVRAESAPIDRKLRALKTELQVWLEQNALLRGELQCRLSSLCGIQEEISEVLRESSECEGAQFTPYQAAKFQGEVLNMQQENNKVANELQVGLDHVRGLQDEIEKALLKLYEDFHLSGSKSSQHPHFRNLSAKNRIPLRSFLFGTKPKRTSIFACMNPAFHKHHRDLRPGFPR
uniref:Protein NETWORKED 2A isoform X2 n=1 Tax=Elaeis guineensis var. tenera TaxID=51953 RepID=A0A6J0PR17_ELAGV|nr:protein NETWORKED 2A isoform X2 [Elaeis guineensis]XP_019710320.1 protein NETWORKED 2A isoform X2 [Elaeis guineensis]XP_029123903.1 protein NETWORKED 2A isoform X2 [Elaeis guineensis]